MKPPTHRAFPVLCSREIVFILRKRFTVFIKIFNAHNEFAPCICTNLSHFIYYIINTF